MAEWQGSRVCKWNPETGEKISEVLGPVKMTVTQLTAGIQHNAIPTMVFGKSVQFKY